MRKVLIYHASIKIIKENKGFDQTHTEFETLFGQTSSIHEGQISSLKSLIQKGTLLKCLKVNEITCTLNIKHWLNINIGFQTHY